MCEFKIGDLVEIKGSCHFYLGAHYDYFEITNISIDESVVFATMHSTHNGTHWRMGVRLQTSWLEHYKIKQERTSIYDTF